jgi:hypothetical protein
MALGAITGRSRRLARWITARRPADLAPILRLFARRFVPHTNGYSVRRPGACAGMAGMAPGGFPCWQIGAGRCPEGPRAGC